MGRALNKEDVWLPLALNLRVLVASLASRALTPGLIPEDDTDPRAARSPQEG